MDLANMIIDAAREQEEKEHVYVVGLSITGDAQETWSTEFTMIKCNRNIKIKSEKRTYTLKPCAHFESLIKKVWQTFLDDAIMKACSQLNTNFLTSMLCKLSKDKQIIYSELRRLVLTNDRRCPTGLIEYLAFVSDPNLIVE